MLIYAEDTTVVLGDLEPPFNENFKKGDTVLIAHHCYNGDSYNEHYTVIRNNGIWFITDSEIDHDSTEQYHMNLKKEKFNE